MTFWRLRYKIWVEGRDYDEVVTQEDLFFEDMEQAMAFILDAKDDEDIESFEIKKCNTAFFKTKYTLNDEERK